MRFRTTIRKIHGVGPHREVTTEQTWARIQPHLRRAGVTRIADITGLDRIGIPVYNAIAPASHDLISVYNGKGATPLDAKTSAVMEAIERHSAWLPMRPHTVSSYEELIGRGEAVLDPRDVNLAVFHRYRLDTPISWVRGWDVMNEESVLVPHYLAGYYVRHHETPPYPINSSNGLASGNSIEEATCHALCELIERDDWTMAEIISNRLSRALTTGSLGLPPSEDLGMWFQDRHLSIDQDTLPEAHQRCIAKYERAGLRLELKNISSATGIPSVLAVVMEDAGSMSKNHQGIGTHPDAGVAVMRAITEAAQSRVVDIQAMREDIAMPDAEVPSWALHVKRSAVFNPQAWAHRTSTTRMAFGQLPNHPSDDVAADLRLMLDSLRGQGMRRAIVVDLSPPDIPVSVVRVIVPGIESWAIDRSKIGPRATAHFHKALATLRAASTVAQRHLAAVPR